MTVEKAESKFESWAGDCSATSCSAPVYPCWLYDHQLNFWWRCTAYPSSVDVSMYNSHWVPDGDKPDFKPNVHVVLPKTI